MPKVGLRIKRRQAGHSRLRSRVETIPAALRSSLVWAICQVLNATRRGARPDSFSRFRLGVLTARRMLAPRPRTSHLA